MPTLAPCIAVVGPANSGKTTLLHLLDRALQHHPSQPLAYVVKGTPDGTGRYLFHAPDLRDALKPDVKGAWCRTTSATVSEWVANARAQLDLALLDFGGRYGVDDDYMLQHCSHFLVLARPPASAAEDEASGAAAWTRICQRNGLQPVGRLRSLWKTGEAAVARAEDGVLDGTFRADATRPEDSANEVMAARLVDHLLALRPARSAHAYVSLKLPREWTLEDLADLGGKGAELDRLVTEEGSVVLGGGAPLWVYGAALHRALDRDPEARVSVFDPKAAGGLVEIPRTLGAAPAEPSSPLAETLHVTWEREGGAAMLRLAVNTKDKMLPPMAFQFLPGAPVPVGPVPDGAPWTSGAMPIWLHLTYSRWLRQRAEGRAIGLWDARRRGIVFVTGPGAPRFEAWELPRAAPSVGG
jgi:energy-coupling factor transporter ATP-binding protein EcfA2